MLADAGFSWHYPLYVAGKNDDWAVVVWEQQGKRTIAVAVFTDEQAARHYNSHRPPVPLLQFNDADRFRDFLGTVTKKSVPIAFVSAVEEQLKIEFVAASAEILAELLRADCA
jgi:hypothetical protein